MEDNKPKAEGGGSFMAAIVRLVNNILEFLSDRKKRQDEERRRKEVEMAKEELRKALSEGRVQDAAYWRKKLMLLAGSLSVAIMVAIGLSGCSTTGGVAPVAPVVVLGERINKVRPGQTLVVPPLVPPARQWYLCDDRGLFEWMDIDLSSPGTRSITNAPPRRQE